MIVVLDTNVIISALNFGNPRSTLVLALGRAVDFDRLASADEIDAELYRILTEKFDWPGSRADHSFDESSATPSRHRVPYPPPLPRSRRRQIPRVRRARSRRPPHHRRQRPAPPPHPRPNPHRHTSRLPEALIASAARSAPIPSSPAHTHPASRDPAAAAANHPEPAPATRHTARSSQNSSDPPRS
jgi:hypothetical protein